MPQPKYIILLATGTLIGLFVTWHLKTEVLVESDFPTAEIEAKDDLFKSFLDEQAAYQSKIVTLREKIEEAQTQIALQSENNDLDKLSALKVSFGLTEITGAGLQITLDDSPFVIRGGENVKDANLVQASDLRDLVNALYAADSEGISINGQRLIASSPLSSVGTTILINNAHISPPFTINAVGDQEQMLYRIVNAKYLDPLFKRRDRGDVLLQIETIENLVIPIYNGDLQAEHINLVK